MSQVESPFPIGEVPLESGNGFRRVEPGPPPLALARMRELLLDVASDGAALSRAGLEGFHSWRFVSTLCGTEWARGSRRASLAARRVLRRRLQALGASAIPFAEAAALPMGTLVHLTGVVRALHQRRDSSHIWSHSAMETHNVRFEVQEGHDFLLVEGSGRTACVIAYKSDHITTSIVNSVHVTRVARE